MGDDKKWIETAVLVLKTTEMNLEKSALSTLGQLCVENLFIFFLLRLLLIFNRRLQAFGKLRLFNGLFV